MSPTDFLSGWSGVENAKEALPRLPERFADDETGLRSGTSHCLLP